MKFLIRGLLITAALAFLSSCGAGGAKFSGLEKPKDNMAQVYVYRSTSLDQFDKYPDIFIDNKKIGELKRGGYLKSSVSSGTHIIGVYGGAFRWPHKNRQYAVKLKAGNTYFYQVSLSSTNAGNYIIRNFSFTQTKDKTKALSDLADLNESK